MMFQQSESFHASTQCFLAVLGISNMSADFLRCISVEKILKTTTKFPDGESEAPDFPLFVSGFPMLHWWHVRCFFIRFSDGRAHRRLPAL